MVLSPQTFSLFLIRQQVMAVDCHLGANPLVYLPPALSHQYAHKTATTRHSVFVGASPTHTCSYQTSTTTFEDLYKKVFWKSGVNGGNAALLFGSFTSKENSKLCLVILQEVGALSGTAQPKIR